MQARHVFISAVMSAALACTDSSAPGGVSGTVTDPAGDATPSVFQVPAPDLIRASIDIEDDSATFTVVFQPGTLKATTFVALVLDIDDDFNTGLHHQGNDLIGIDYSLEFGAGVEGGLKLYRYNGATYDDVPLTVDLVVGSNTLSTTIPLSVFNDDDGLMSFKGGTAAQSSTGTYSTALDWLPNPGQEPGRVR